MQAVALPRFGQVYIWVVIVAGTLIIGDSLYEMYRVPVGYQWFLLAALTLISGSTTVRLPSSIASISISETFVFTAVLLYGPAAGTLIVTLGLSAIHVTHDQVEAMAIADRIVLLDSGVIAQEGSPTKLYNEPATLFAAEFMGSNNRLDGSLVENSNGRAAIELFGDRLTGIARTKAPAGGKATGIIRIERVRCASNPGPNRLKMQLKAPMYLGERWELTDENVQAEKKVFAERAVLGHLAQVSVSRRDDARVGLGTAGAADSEELFLLQNAQ